MAEDLGLSKRPLMSRTKLLLNNGDATNRYKHTSDLSTQGQMMHCTTERGAHIWLAAINLSLQVQVY